MYLKKCRIICRQAKINVTCRMSLINIYCEVQYSLSGKLQTTRHRCISFPSHTHVIVILVLRLLSQTRSHAQFPTSSISKHFQVSGTSTSSWTSCKLRHSICVKLVFIASSSEHAALNQKAHSDL